MPTTKMRTYSDLVQLNTFEDRFEYLRLGSGVGRATFAFDRYVNQRFYSSPEWQSIRSFVIVRDNSCDLGIPGLEIFTSLLIHHMNPMSVADISHKEDWILDPEYLITTRHDTHNAIHFGVKKLHPKVVTERTPNDTRLWGRSVNGRG